MVEDNKWLMSEFVGKTILVKTHGGMGTRDVSLKVGEYKGVLLGFDGAFMKLEYEITKFSGGASQVTKDVILINVAFVITVNEFHEREG